ncbi:hypothetical protein P2G88_01480 [Aliiglaciecola sp. CAU 1673]|uniref:hypothetical protein n=1 Tax=Aliiglaciecola sp. CAU 1673 TaxID=3032595 RepID=UPI0023DC4644|nr:hypothetical protein [Aliiglaciecola sp. CAU 1673]MDF2176923.1 hypothetical protein [Aliiglaciecola sp. CAU 1673]
MQYLVNWKALFRDLFKKLVVILGGIFIVLSLLEFVRSDYDFYEAFKHMEMLDIPIIVAVIIAASFLCALAVAFASKMSAITITDREVIGRNYFGFKKSLPFSQITKAYHQSDRGFESIVLFGGSFFNSIYFPVFLTEIDDAMKRLKQENITIEE